MGDDTTNSTDNMQDAVDAVDENLAAQDVDPAEVKPEDKAQLGEEMADGTNG